MERENEAQEQQIHNGIYRCLGLNCSPELLELPIPESKRGSGC